jgi:uncharacterized protein YlxW (UPF0749 family)
MTGDEPVGRTGPAVPQDDDVVVPHPFGPRSPGRRLEEPAGEAVPGESEPAEDRPAETTADPVTEDPAAAEESPAAGKPPVAEGSPVVHESDAVQAPDAAEESDAPEEPDASKETDAAEAPDGTGQVAESAGASAGARPSGARVTARRRRDPLAAALIGVLTLLLGFAFAVQVRNVGNDQLLAGAREEDLVRILDDLNAREERLREQIADQRSALQQLTSSDSQSATALEEARRRAEAIGILNGTIAAQGPGLTMTVRDPDDAVRVADILDAIQELRGAGAETMQIDGVRVGVSTAVTGDPGHLMVDGRPITAPYEFVVIGSPQNMETAMNIPGGVVPRFTSRGGSVSIVQSDEVVVDALRPLDTPQYASPDTGG